MPCETRSMDFIDEPISMEVGGTVPVPAPAAPPPPPPPENPVTIPRVPEILDREGIRGGPASVPGFGLFGRR